MLSGNLERQIFPKKKKKKKKKSAIGLVLRILEIKTSTHLPLFSPPYPRGWGSVSSYVYKSSSLTLNEMAKKARKIYCNFEFQRRSHTMTEINQNRAKITKTVKNI